MLRSKLITQHRQSRLQHSCLGKRLYEPSAKLNIAEGSHSTLNNSTSAKPTIQNSTLKTQHCAQRLCRHSDGDILLFFKIFVHKEVFKLLTNISFCSYLFINLSQFFVNFHKEHVRIIIFFTDICNWTFFIVFAS